MTWVSAGAARIDITPDRAMIEDGLTLAGFAARTEPALGVHDALTARAVVVGDTAIVVADVIGLHEETSARIRERCALPAANVIVAATHTHGAPASVPGRLGAPASEAFVRLLEDGCVAAIDAALASARPAKLSIGLGADPGVARNRRHADGPLDRSLPVLRLRGEDGTLLAILVSYACHPVVLGADSRLITGDYPHVVRTHLEAAEPGAIALFLTGCCGDANTGHSARDSWSREPSEARSFEAAERIGRRIAEASLEAGETPLGTRVAAGDVAVVLDLERREDDLPRLAAGWRAEMASADPVHRIVLAHWCRWAETYAGTSPGTWTGRVGALHWGGVRILGLPGEIFGETALQLRAALGDAPAFVLSYAEAMPGYIPPTGEFPFGGYEVDEAHRYIGMPAAFAPGSAERLVAAGAALSARLTGDGGRPSR